ncbi:ABC transporter permease [Alicyclobacillus kakegawensis]|uniref:ABC transporter permease n=1 Tax=Alicyclobacillus kakegawensis TaxID=392012 RepID=UPI000AF1A27A|nr:ABC transporter permease subunit [Alicyclobacillus kakegawensis]
MSDVMTGQAISEQPVPKTKSRPVHELWRRVWKERWIYALFLPGFAYFIIFKYWPMWGVIMAFENYQPFQGVLGSQWVGLENFQRFFSDPAFWQLFRNTFILAVYNIVFFFPCTIIVALLLNELRIHWFKSSVQTLIYIPHFFSWTVVVGITYMLLTTQGGLVNELLNMVGLHQVNFLESSAWFRPLIVIQDIWKETGWGTIIFLAALAGVNVELYEAARIDGANRLQQLWHVTLPAIRGVIIIMFILRLGSFLDVGFEQIWLMLNAMNRDVGEVFDTYVYTLGLQQGQFSYSAAIGLFKSVVGLILVLGANKVAKLFGEEGIY